MNHVFFGRRVVANPWFDGANPWVDGLQGFDARACSRKHKTPPDINYAPCIGIRRRGFSVAIIAGPSCEVAIVPL